MTAFGYNVSTHSRGNGSVNLTNGNGITASSVSESGDPGLSKKLFHSKLGAY
jgi:hypothetical protein